MNCIRLIKFEDRVNLVYFKITMNNLKKIILFTQYVFFTILGPNLYIHQVHATGLDAQSGQLEYTCYNKSGGTFKRPPINIKFSGKNFYGEVKFFSNRRQKYFIQTFSGMFFYGNYKIDSEIYNINRKKVSKPGLIKYDLSKGQNINLIKYLKSGVNSNFNNRRCVLKLVSVSTSVSDDRIAAAEKKLEKARKKRLEEQQRKLEEERKIAEEKAKKKRLEEQQRKLEEERKIAEEKARKVSELKTKATNFYKDIEEFVKSGGNIDLVKLSNFFGKKPNPNENWSTSDLTNYKNLRKFMSSVQDFVTFEKQKIGERFKNSIALKDSSITKLKKNLKDLKILMREMFGSSDMPKITALIEETELILANFDQIKANKILIQTSSFITRNFANSKPVEENKSKEKVKNVAFDQSWSNYKSKMSIQQSQFCQLTDSFFNDLEDAKKSKNEIKVNIVHKLRQGDLDALIPQGKINNWIFKVIKIDQVEDGSAAVVLSLQCKSFVGSGQIHTKSTWRKKSNKEWRATIPYNDRRFRELAKLSSGEFVVASGVMLEIGAYKPGQKETFYAFQPIGEHPLTKGLNLMGELFVADLSYIAALN